MAVYKVLARCPYSKRQQIKKIYENDVKFTLYGKATAKRYQHYHNVEIYKMEDDAYELIAELKMPTTREELLEYCQDNEINERWIDHRLADIEKDKQRYEKR